MGNGATAMVRALFLLQLTCDAVLVHLNKELLRCVVVE